FALIMFCGLIVFNVFAECVTRAPGLILANANYVKKVVFPLEILPVTVLASALVHAAVSLLVLLLGLGFFLGILQWTIIFVPVIFLPLALFCLGFGWFLASLGVYIRDIGQVVGVLIPALMFLSPIFYPLSAVPELFRPLYHVNPLTFIVENMQAVVIWGQLPDWQSMGIGTAVALGTALIGYAWFERTRGGFADVL
ncbi:MAG: ABC transporter permease, partial [Candidatus Binatia bacterium]